MKTRLQNCPNIINIFQMLSGGSNESDPGMVSFARWVVGELVGKLVGEVLDKVVGELVGKLVGELRRAMSGTVVSTLEEDQCMQCMCMGKTKVVSGEKQVAYCILGAHVVLKHWSESFFTHS